MSKQKITDAVQLASQTVPFLIITAIFVSIAYAYGQHLTPYHMGEYDLVRLSCNYLP